MAIIGAYAFSNLGSFGEDQKLKNAAQDVQSFLRLAQSNATSNVKCGTQFGALWFVQFADWNTIQLYCRNLPASPSIIKTLKLDTNIKIQNVSGIPSSVCPSAGSTVFTSFTIKFVLLTGKIIIGPNTRCTSLTITLVNNKNSSTRDMKIEQGGRIYAQ